jgi:acetyl esterase/lipase
VKTSCRSIVRVCSAALLLVLVGCAGQRIRSASQQVRIVEDLSYVPGSSHPKQKLDLYLPRDRTDFPMVLFVHGGFWRNQDRRYYQAFTGLHGNVGVALAKRGLGVAVQSYRLIPEATLQDQLADVVAAARFTLEHAKEYGGSARTLILAGFSAGGHLVTTLCVEPERLSKAGLDPAVLRGCVSVSGVLDVVAMAQQQDASFNREVTVPHFGPTPEQQAQFSPVLRLTAQTPPLLLLWAEKDYLFVKQAGQAAVEKLKSLGVTPASFELLRHDHADMVLRINSSDDQVTERIAAFATAQSQR